MRATAAGSASCSGSWREIAIAACDLAEVIGSAIALNLLFHIPLFYGVLITGLDVLLILLLQRWGFRYIEALVIALIGTIIALFGVQMFLSRPDYWPALRNLFVPSPSIVTNPAMLYIAIGILGATVMPHNLYLHSSIVQSRRYKRTPEGQARGHAHGQRGFGSGADRGAVCERGNSDRCRGGLPSQRASSRSPPFRTPTSCSARWWARPARARCLPSRCWPAGRTPRSPERSPARW